MLPAPQPRPRGHSVETRAQFIGCVGFSLHLLLLVVVDREMVHPRGAFLGEEGPCLQLALLRHVNRLAQKSQAEPLPVGAGEIVWSVASRGTFTAPRIPQLPIGPVEGLSRVSFSTPPRFLSHSQTSLRHSQRPGWTASSSSLPLPAWVGESRSHCSGSGRKGLEVEDAFHR